MSAPAALAAERRALGDSLRRLIAAHGPISVQRWMAEANARYYDTRDPLGAAADFVTAPEISQMFGELIGLWLADMWSRAGRPDDACYVELGPGRGTLARDALRAAAAHGLAPAVHLVEGSRALAAAQRAALPGATWHADLASVPGDRPLLVVANEFLDALPARQLVRTPESWRERMVGLDAHGRFVPVGGAFPVDAAVPPGWRDAPLGTIVETSPAATALVGELAARLADHGGAALLIDYGHERPRSGSTLQAVRAHRRHDPFADPGEADLSAHVDFAALAEVAARGARWLGTAPQGAWLERLGIAARAERLAAANPREAGAIAAALARLTDPAQMGSLFKVMGLAAPGWPEGAGF